VTGLRTAKRCAHCGLDAGADPRSSDGKVFCCAGCEAVYFLLHDEGLGAFYEAGGVGSLAAHRARAAVDTRISPPALAPFDAAGAAELDVVGMSCASCAWLIERYIGRSPGVGDVRVSYATGTATLRWDPSRTTLGALLAALERIGYRARPAEPRLRVLQGGREDRVLLVRTGLSLFLAMNVMLASLGLYVGEMQGMSGVTREMLRALAGVLALPVVFWGGWPFLKGSVTALRAGRATMDTLVAVGATAALAASLGDLLRAGGGPVYFDSAAMIVALVLLGRTFEQGARKRGIQAIRSLLALEPATARPAGGEALVDAAGLEVGQEIDVRPGERFPCDGTVLAGRTEADESLLTGESRPREAGPGDVVHGGALNGWGAVRVRADRVGAETAVARIARSVERALASRARVERLADRVTGVFVPAVLLLGAAAAAGWWLATGDAGRSVMTGVAVVVISCPCALGLATPAALVVALGGAARRGIFFRDADALERAAAVGLVAFDKTGTLTDGALRVREVLPEPGWTAGEVLRLAAAAELPSEHALGRALVAAARERQLALGAPEGFRAVAGGGVEAMVEGRAVLVGSPAFLRSRGVACVTGTVGETVAAVAVQGVLTGVVLAGDTVRPEAADAVADLAALGVGLAVLSGDGEGPVRRAAADAGIPAAQAHHGLSPEAKASLMNGWRTRGGVTALVGDGVNDAPALVAAGVGFALGTGTDVAIEAADVALSGSDLRAVPEALRIARRARRVVRQNLVWALGYNVAAVPLAMAGLVHPAIAAGAMAFSSVSVLLNATRAGLGATPRDQHR
jgi:Cu2+-exporting ATPase